MEIPKHNAVLPDAPYALWESGELHDLLLLPHDGTRVEIIGGEIVVSPAPVVPHANIIQDISDALVKARLMDPAYPWVSSQGTNLTRIMTGDGYIPDLLVMAQDVRTAAAKAHAPGFMPDEVEMVVEVTSPSRSALDRPPADPHSETGRTKWSGYAQVKIAYYLLVDRSPKAAKTTLYSIPAQDSSAYLHEESWPFGETIRLPEPFDIEVDTSLWEPWKS
ncbi:Uma2 family endonuclease [Actinomadura vinacea]|uniref:Uma2 family endonuclease n=1 Tax=Actinomadura vinacea TaxID=115336 RepID=UPI0031D7A155